METILTILKRGHREVALHQGEVELFRIHDRTVYRDGMPHWQMCHLDHNLFSGTWRILSLADQQVLASYRYLAASYRYGEDLRIVDHRLDMEYLFRRVDPERDRWLLLSRTGDVLLESQPPEAGEEGGWTLRLTGGDLEAHWPILCLLIFDRLISDRF